jgi:hypothetical protein
MQVLLIKILYRNSTFPFNSVSKLSTYIKIIFYIDIFLMSRELLDSVHWTSKWGAIVTASVGERQYRRKSLINPFSVPWHIVWSINLCGSDTWMKTDPDLSQPDPHGSEAPESVGTSKLALSWDSRKWKLYIRVPKFYLCQLSLNASGVAATKTYRPDDKCGSHGGKDAHHPVIFIEGLARR